MSEPKKRSEPVRHHYIPRFILRPFCFDGDRMHFYSKKSASVVIEDIKDVFMLRNLYRDELNNPDDPVYIEGSLAVMEREASVLIRKLRDEKDIVLSKDQNDMLKLFFAVMSFRNKRAYDFFSSGHSDQTGTFYEQYQPDLDLGSFWKRNLGYISQCRSINDVMVHPDIDPPMKIFMKRDTDGILGKYFIVTERRGNEDFIIGDCYPTVIRETFGTGMSIDMICAIPVSPSRMIFLVDSCIETEMSYIKGIKKELVLPPPLSRNSADIIVPVRKIYERDVKWLNAVMMKNAAHGFVFKDRDRTTIEPSRWSDELLFV